MAYEIVATPNIRVLLALHTGKSPSQAEWDGWCSLLRSSAESVEGDLARFANLVVTDGGAPSTAQRTTVNSLIVQGKNLPRVAVVTDSLAVRTIARGFSLFNPLLKVFRPEDFPAAMEFLTVTSWQRAVVAALLDLERRELGVGAVHTLRSLVGKRG